MLTDAGFVRVRWHGWTGYRTSPYTEGALITAEKPASAEVASPSLIDLTDADGVTYSAG